MKLLDIEAVVKETLSQDLLPGFTAEAFRTVEGTLQIRVSRTFVVDLLQASNEASLATLLDFTIVRPLEASVRESVFVLEEEAKHNELLERLDHIETLISMSDTEELDSYVGED